MRTKRILAWFV